MASTRIPCKVSACFDLNDFGWDGIILVTDSLAKLANQSALQVLKTTLEALKEIDSAVEKAVVLTSVNLPAKRLIFSPTGPLDRDYDDVRRFAEAAEAGIKRSIAAGCKKPLLVRAPDNSFPQADLVTLLGALHALYVPIEVREDVPQRAMKIDALGFFFFTQNSELLNLAMALESGRLVSRDIGGSDPERMTAKRVADYVQGLFRDTPISVKVVSDEDGLIREYPLFSAVDRCAKLVERHRGRIVELEYVGSGTIDTTLMLVGKGVTYDTGGADIKAGGVMAGMHRDKCGAASVAGFFQVLAMLKPENIKVVGALSMVRNSVGVESYVADEIITSRAGVRVRIGNTDAEGRMAMTDVLCKMKERAPNEVNPHLYTLATLTGHAIIAMGDAYSIVMDNGPARQERHSQKLQAAGDIVGDPLEISNIRREDFEFHVGKSEYEDVLQCNNLPSTRTPRGHQSPAAFMIMASGLDKHGKDSSQPLKYSHMDLSSSGPFPGVPTGSPVCALAAFHLLERPRPK